MKHYFAIEGQLYTLTNNQNKKWKLLFPYKECNENEQLFSDSLDWVKENGKYIAQIEILNY